MGSGIPKQLRSIAGRSVLLHCLDAFCGLVDEVIIPVSADIKQTVEELLSTEAYPFPIQIITGGKTRQASVHAGLLACTDSQAVLIHDAARPLIRPSHISACLDALKTEPVVLLALPCTDTVKQYDQACGKLHTLDRNHIYLAQTPQCMHRQAALTAFALAAAEQWDCTDDVSIMERHGHAVHIIEGERRNLKLTSPEDWALAEWYYRQG